MDSLKDICEEMLLKDLDQETVLFYLGVAEQFSVRRLKVSATELSELLTSKMGWWMN